MSLGSIITMPADGRQSETALMIARGTQRLLLALGLSCVSELSLLSGRRADLVALGGDGEIWIPSDAFSFVANAASKPMR